MTSRGRRWWAPLVLALLVVLAGCGGAGNAGGGGGEDASAGGEIGSEATAATAGAGGGAGSAGGETGSAGGERTAEAIGSEEVLQIERRQALVRTGRVALTVENVSATERELTRVVRDAGGFVSSSRVRRDDREEGTVVTGQLVVRVPAENFSTAFARIERAGEVRASNTSTRDVSEQLVDIEARLENLRAQRERLRGLYAQANDTEALLAIQERLSEVQSRIERLEARRQSLRRQVALSTIVIDLAEPLAGPDDRSREWYDTGVLAAVLDSFGGVLMVLRAIVVGLAYVLPYLLVFGVPIAVLAYLLRYRRRGEERDAA
jgi:hypothetical protein